MSRSFKKFSGFSQYYSSSKMVKRKFNKSMRLLIKDAIKKEKEIFPKKEEIENWWYTGQSNYLDKKYYENNGFMKSYRKLMKK